MIKISESVGCVQATAFIKLPSFKKKRNSFQLFFFFPHLVERQLQRARHVNLRVFLPACMSQTVRLEKGI